MKQKITSLSIVLLLLLWTPAGLAVMDEKTTAQMNKMERKDRWFRAIGEKARVDTVPTKQVGMVTSRFAPSQWKEPKVGASSQHITSGERERLRLRMGWLAKNNTTVSSEPSSPVSSASMKRYRMPPKAPVAKKVQEIHREQRVNKFRQSSS